jgi:hypothetical protein
MPFKKGTSGNPIGRPKGAVSTNQYPLVNNYKASTLFLSKVYLYLYMEKINDENSMNLQDYCNLLALLVFLGVAVYVFYQLMFV